MYLYNSLHAKKGEDRRLLSCASLLNKTSRGSRTWRC